MIRALLSRHAVGEDLIRLPLHQFLEGGLVIPAALFHSLFPSGVQQEAVNQGGGKIPLIQTDGERWNSDAELKYGVAAIPSLYIFGPDRTLLEKTRGWRSGKVKQIFEKYIDAKVSD